MKKEFFIPGNVPSLKNSKIKTVRGIFPSKAVMKYLKSLGVKKYSCTRKTVDDYVTKPNIFRESLKDFPTNIPYPVKLGFHFVRRTKTQFDFNNATQIIQDLLVAHNFIEDDSMNYLIPFVWNKNGKYYSVDKENPGVYLKLDI
jgi:hypothetical protein